MPYIGHQNLSAFIGDLLITGIMPIIGQLNKSVVGLGSPAPSGIDLTCKSYILCISISINVFLVFILQI